MSLVIRVDTQHFPLASTCVRTHVHIHLHTHAHIHLSICPPHTNTHIYEGGREKESLCLLKADLAFLSPLPKAQPASPLSSKQAPKLFRDNRGQAAGASPCALPTIFHLPSSSAGLCEPLRNPGRPVTSSGHRTRIHPTAH